MNKRLLLATTAIFALATSALAQTSPATTSPSTQRQPESSSAQTPSGSGQSTTPNSSAQSQAPASSSQKGAQATSPNTRTSQPNPAQTSPQSGQSGTNVQSGQSQTGTSSNHAQINAPSTSQSGSQVQQGTGSTTTAQQPQQGTGATNTAQQPQQGAGSTTTAQQPSSNQNTASSSTSVNASVNINDQQRTRISESVSRLSVQPLTSVNFSLSVGTVVPADVRLQPLPTEVVEIVPQYRGYDFVLVKDEIVIVEPSTKKIVTVLPYSGRSTAAAPARTEQHKTSFSDRDREVIRKHVKAHPVERRTSGSTVRTEIRRGERVPEGVEVEVFPEEVYREAPTLREYRYINRDSRTYIVEPHDRRIIEEID